MKLFNQLSPVSDQMTETLFYTYCQQLSSSQVRAAHAPSQTALSHTLVKSHIIVLEDPTTHEVIATGKIMVEQKLYGKKMGHIEDIVVLDTYRNQGLGKQIINELIKVGNDAKCYKIVLCCNPSNVQFYEKCGFQMKGSEMTYYLPEFFV